MPAVSDPPATVATNAPLAASRSLIERAERIALFIAALLVAALHVANLFFAGPLWRDEIGDAQYAAMPSWAHIWSMLKYDNFPPLLIVLLRTWRALGLEDIGGHDFGYRVLGLLIGLGTATALWLNARLLGGARNAPWFSLGLFAAGGFVVRVGDSIRPYGPGWLCMLLTFGLLWRVVQSPRPGRIASALLAAVLSVQCLYQNAFLLLAIGTAGMLVAARARRWQSVAAVAGIGAVAALSIVPYVLGPVHDAGAWSMISRPGLGWDHMAEMILQAAGSLNRASSWLWLPAIGAVAWATFTLPRHDEDADARWYAAGSAIIAFPVFVGFLKGLGMSTTPWYYLLPLALAANALDILGAAMTSDWRWRVGRLAFLAVALGVALPFGWVKVQERVTNADVIAAQVGRLAKPGDCVLVEPWPYGVSFNYYYHGDAFWTTVPALADHSIHRYDLMKERIASADGIAPILARLGETLQSGHRVWLIGQIDAPPENLAVPTLLPAPHDRRVGWDEASYMGIWMLQIGEYLRAYGVHVADAPPHMEQKVSMLEDMQMACVEGWQP